MKVSSGHIVSVTYNLYTFEGDKEVLVEAATESKPLVYCHGEGLMLSHFESSLEGLGIGEPFDFVLSSANAYGDYSKESVLELDKKLFYNAEGQFDYERVYEGNIVQMETTDGQNINARIVHIGSEKVTIDLNHPMSGKDLHFIGKVIDIRVATESELEQIRNRHGHSSCGGCGGGCKREGGEGCGKEERCGGGEGGCCQGRCDG